jgi:anti-sigma factor RsiW
VIGRHAGRWLSAYAQGQLPPAEERRVADHLAACAACRAELQEIRFGIRLAGAIPATTTPAVLWTSIERALDGGAAAPERSARPAWRRRLVYAAPLLLLAGGLGWYIVSRPGLHVHHAPPALSTIERTALYEHERRLRGEEDWAVRSDEAPPIRRWVEERTGLSTSIPDERPVEDAGRLRLVGARLGRAGTARAAVIGYEIDARPVTLVTANLSDLADPPPEWRLSKGVTFRLLPAGGHKVLAWGSDGQAYAIVSDLPGYGQEACFVCHTAPDRRALIRTMRVRPD